MTDDKTKEVIDVLAQIEQDCTVPKNIREKVKVSLVVLQDNGSILAVKINRSLQELDEIANDPNLESYTRAQIWQAVSLLESI